jgi:DNA-binding MarR family transcriptional regulator
LSRDRHEILQELVDEIRASQRATDAVDEAASRAIGVNRVIDRLERMGYVRRVADPADRRRVLVELTPRIVKRIEELMGPLGDQGFPLVDRYSDEQLELLVEFTRAGRQLQERHAQWLREQSPHTPGRKAPEDS